MAADGQFPPDWPCPQVSAMARASRMRVARLIGTHGPRGLSIREGVNIELLCWQGVLPNVIQTATMAWRMEG